LEERFREDKGLLRLHLAHRRCSLVGGLHGARRDSVIPAEQSRDVRHPLAEGHDLHPHRQQGQQFRPRQRCSRKREIDRRIPEEPAHEPTMAVRVAKLGERECAHRAPAQRPYRDVRGPQ
jgi:hypothetical protein